jgi:hypothetical protein
MGGEKMLEIKKTGIAFDEKELIKLEEIITDQDEPEALKFLKRAVYSKIAKGQQNRLKSHLDARGDPVEGFKNR